MANSPVFERPALIDSLRERARAGAPLLLTGPPGAGKTHLLHDLAHALVRDGFTVVSLDLMAAASSPERFVVAALGSLPAERFAARMGEALEIRRLAAAGRAHGAAAVHALFSLWASLDEAGGRPVALLLDEATEIQSLAYFAGLRDVAQPFGQAMLARRRGTILSTSFKTLASRLWALETLELPALEAAELSPYASPTVVREILCLSFGWPRYARVLLEAGSDSVEQAWVREMALGGRLEVACRASYESLLLRSRGYGMSKALLALVAHAPGQNLTKIYRELRRSPGATRDYLGWLLGVDAIRMEKKCYDYVDGLLREWVRLHVRGRLPTQGEIEAAADTLLATADSEQRTELEPASPSRGDEPSSRDRNESLMEID